MLKLKFACGPYDRIEPLRDGRVSVPGVDLDVTCIQSPRDLFDRMNNGDEFDIAEMSSSEFVADYCAGSRRYVAIPVFPSKVFRHGFITINANAGIHTPKDLEGRRIGVPLYTQTAAIWIRGLLEEDYGVDLSNVLWVQGAVEQAGAHGDAHPPALLKPVRIEINSGDESLEQLLLRGAIDAILGARLPPALGRDARVMRLFPDFRAREQDYYRRTRIHPIMHLVVIKRRLWEDNPWLAPALYQAFEEAKSLAWSDLCFPGAQKIMLPWVFADIAEAQSIFGPGDPWPYGVEANRPTLEALLDYMHRQNFIAEKPTLEELFVEV